MKNTPPETLEVQLRRIADSLERLAPATDSPPLPDDANAFIWHAEDGKLIPVRQVARIPITLLMGIDQAKNTLLINTRHFSKSLPANNALLWGARGMGKSSLVKAVHADVSPGPALSLVEIHREDIHSLPRLMERIRREPRRFIMFCDDLSFDDADTSYKSLKAALEGGLEGRPANVIFYATSNRRHLMPRYMMENEKSTAISPSEAVEEKVSLSDRFGLWIGFHHCSQQDYLTIVHAYAAHYLDSCGGVPEEADLSARALEWAAARGDQSGRVAWQFIMDLAGKLGAAISPPGTTHS